MNKTEKYLIHLVKTTLYDLQPLEKEEDVSWNDIYMLSKAHSIANVVFESINKVTNGPKGELYKQWNEVYLKAIKKDIIQRHELDLFKQYCRKHQIPILLLKGCVMKKYYPRNDLRTMADLDIYVEESNYGLFLECLLQHGYEQHGNDFGHHREFYKEPVMNIEVHNQFINNQYPHIQDYYKNIKEKRMEIEPYIYSFNLEEEYIFMIIHHYKHYIGAGAGIRHIMDYDVWMKHNQDKVNWSYISSILIQLGIKEFEERIQLISQNWFHQQNNECLDEETFILKSGTYGTISHYLTRQLQDKSKLQLLIYRLFMPLSQMKTIYPILNKYPFLIVFCWIHRFIRAIKRNGKRILYELKFITHFKKDS